MSGEITTRRALEVVLSRVPMSKHSAQELLYALQRWIEAPTNDIVDDEPKLRTAIMLMAYQCDGCDLNFPKKALLGRMETIREIASRTLER